MHVRTAAGIVELSADLSHRRADSTRKDPTMNSRLEVPPEHQALVQQLAVLPGRERRAVFAAAEAAARPKDVSSWDAIEAMSGVVALGGDAVEDCDRLYDG